MTINRDNLVVLAYSSNSCHTSFFKLDGLEKLEESSRSFDPEDLRIDLEGESWFFRGWRFPIGHGRNGLGPYNETRWGVIGVYDHTQYEHVQTLVRNAQEAVEQPPYGHMASDD